MFFNNKKATLPCYFFLIAINFLGFTLKIVVFYRKYIAKITKSHYKTTVFDNYKADIYCNKINRKKDMSPCKIFLCNI